MNKYEVFHILTYCSRPFASKYLLEDMMLFLNERSQKKGKIYHEAQDFLGFLDTLQTLPSNKILKKMRQYTSVPGILG